MENNNWFYTVTILYPNHSIESMLIASRWSANPMDHINSSMELAADYKLVLPHFENKFDSSKSELLLKYKKDKICEFWDVDLTYQ